MEYIAFKIWSRAILLALVAIACCWLLEAGEFEFLLFVTGIAAIMFGFPLLVAFYIFLHLARPFMKTTAITTFLFLLCSVLAAATGILIDMIVSGIGPFSNGFEYELYGAFACGAALFAVLSVLTYYRTIHQFTI